MTIRHLTIFLAVAEYGSMSAAANKLYLSQPTISQAIRELETHYNGLLFERLGKKLFLTDLGKQLQEEARPLVKEFHTLDEQMIKHSQTAALKLGSSITVGTCLTPSVISNLSHAFPDLLVYSCVSNTQEIEKKLLQSELDAAIVEGEISSPDLITIPMVDDCLVLACGQTHPFYHKTGLLVSELAGQSFAMREPGSGTRLLFEEFMQHHKLSYHVSWEANCPRTLINAVLAGQALSVMSLRLLQHEIRHKTVHIFCNATGEWDRKFCLVYHRHKHLTPPILYLQEILSRYQNIQFPEELYYLKEK